MSKFLNLITAANAASAAASAYDLKQQQEDYAQEAWERDEAKKEREEEKSREREQRQAKADERREREKRWDYKTEGIRGGIEAIKQYRDPRFRLKLLKWHKEGMLRTDEEIENIKSLITETVDLIISDELKKILSGEYDDVDSDEGALDPDSYVHTRAHSLKMLYIEIFNNDYSEYCSTEVAKQFNEVCDASNKSLEMIMEKNRKRELSEAYKSGYKLGLNRLIALRTFPEKIIGGVIGWFCKDSPGNKKWWIRGVCVFVTPGLGLITVPAYLLLWAYVEWKANKEIRYYKLGVRNAELDEALAQKFGKPEATTRG